MALQRYGMPYGYHGRCGFYISNGANYVTNPVGGGVAGDLLATVAAWDNFPRDANGNPDDSVIVPPPGWVIVKTFASSEGGDPRTVGRYFAVFEYILTGQDAWQTEWRVTVNSLVDTRLVMAIGSLFSGEKSVSAVGVSIETTPSINHYPAGADWWTGNDRRLQMIIPARFEDAGYHVGTIWDSDTVPVNDIQPQSKGYNEGAWSDGSLNGKYWRTYRAGSYNRVLVPGTCVMVTLTLTTVPRPMAPVITMPPKNTWTDLSSRGVTVSWQPFNGFATPQTGWTLTCYTSYGTFYWNALTGNFSTSSVTNSGTTSSVTIPASCFPAGTSRNSNHTFTASVVAGGYQSPASNTRTVLNTAPPVSAASIVARGSNGILGSLLPQANLSFAPGNPTIAVTDWEAKLLENSVEVAAGAGVLTGGQKEVLWAPGVQVANLSTVQVMVRCLQMGGEWSPWAISEEAEANVTVPIAPSVVATPTTHGVSGVPGVHVTIDWDALADSYDWETQSSTGYLARQAPDGAWSLVGTFPLPPGITEASITDYGSELGEVSYRAWATGTAVDGSTLLGHQGEGTVEVLSHKSWLVDPRHPETAMKLNRVEEGTRTRPVDITVSEAVGRADSLVSYGQVRLMTGSEKVRVDTPQEEQALVALLTSGAVLKLSATPERQGMARGTEAKTVYPPNLWFRPSGDFTIERLDGKGLYSQHYISFPWVEQKPPVATVEQVSW